MLGRHTLAASSSRNSSRRSGVRTPPAAWHGGEALALPAVCSVHRSPCVQTGGERRAGDSKRCAQLDAGITARVCGAWRRVKV